jgi:ATP phosphoribosyltransferase regulatory subunit
MLPDRQFDPWVTNRRTQAEELVSFVRQSGYVLVSPPIIQPAGKFFDVVGEKMRAQTFLCTDASGRDLCLRSDLTVPTAELYLSRFPEGDIPAKYVYSGPVFRAEEAKDAERIEDGEIYQIGLESFGHKDEDQADVEVLGLVEGALRWANLRAFSIKLGDVGLLTALVNHLGIPSHWQRKFWHYYRQSDTDEEDVAGKSASVSNLQALTRYLEEIQRPQDRRFSRIADAALKEKIRSGAIGAATEAVQAYLNAREQEPFGTRSVADIAARLAEFARDAVEPPLTLKKASLVLEYLKINESPDTAVKRIKEMFGADASEEMRQAIARFERRLALFRQSRIDLEGSRFAADFGRDFAYYTGFVFEISVPRAPAGKPIAGGGRYNKLLKAVGCPNETPAVGAAIYTDRLLAAKQGASL